MEAAAVLAVAHSPSAGASEQEADEGAIVLIWASVTEVSRAERRGIGVADERNERERRRVVVRVEWCILMVSIPRFQG